MYIICNTNEYIFIVILPPLSLSAHPSGNISKDPYWQLKRKIVFHHSEYHCQWCGEEAHEVHHWAYCSNGFPFEILMALCGWYPCHENITSLIRKERYLRQGPPSLPLKTFNSLPHW